MIEEAGWFPFMNEPTFIRYLSVKIAISDLEKVEHDSEKDLEKFTAESNDVVCNFVKLAISMYKYHHPDCTLTFAEVKERLECLWMEDTFVLREKELQNAVG